jgi:hypothetical protein
MKQALHSTHKKNLLMGLEIMWALLIPLPLSLLTLLRLTLIYLLAKNGVKYGAAKGTAV